MNSFVLDIPPAYKTLLGGYYGQLKAVDKISLIERNFATYIVCYDSAKFYRD